jgi:hypothetical protein
MRLRSRGLQGASDGAAISWDHAKDAVPKSFFKTAGLVGDWVLGGLGFERRRYLSLSRGERAGGGHA